MEKYGPAITLALALGFAAGCRQTPTSPSTAIGPLRTPTVDVLDYLIGERSLWPRTGDQLQHQVVDPARREVCWVKYANPSMFECWRWDDEWVYHVVDHGLDGNTGESYRFTDGRWLPRRLARGATWTLDVPDNRIRWFTATCAEVRGPQGIRIDEGPNVFPMRLQAWVEESRNTGGDLGVRDVLVFAYASYAPGDKAGPPELFYFARGAGWYRWESVRGVRTFDRLGGPAVSLDRRCGDFLG
jgi:hypothetical protein